MRTSVSCHCYSSKDNMEFNFFSPNSLRKLQHLLTQPKHFWKQKFKVKCLLH